MKPTFYSYRANDDMSDNGPRTAAVLTFSGDSNDSIVKELTQNSLDARVSRGGKLQIKIDCRKLKKSDIPNFSEFEGVLNSMESYWNGKSNQYETFFRTAKGSIEGDSVEVFVFEDYKTKGLQGDDYEGTFKYCVNDENVSGKEHSDSLGNHGIGKNAVFGYSGIHTVFYSSLNTEGEYKFKGVSKLGNYNDSEGVKRAERIYYGRKEGESIKMVSSENDIPSVFRRTDQGLSQFVLGVSLGDDWADNIRKAFIENYWFLFESDILTVDIAGDILDKSNYIEEAERLFSDDKSKENPIPFITAYKNGIIVKTREIFKIGEVHMYLMEAENGTVFPNKVVFLRDGMKIKLDNLNVGGLPLPVAGVMFCNNSKGNSILGAMEPHAHNDFLPELVAKKQTDNISVNDAKKILWEIREFKKDVLKELKSKYMEEAENVDAVDELFSQVLGIGIGRGAGKLSPSGEETFYRKINSVDLEVVFSTNTRNTLVNLNSETNYGPGDGPGVGEGEGGDLPHDGTGRRNRKKGTGGASMEDGDKTGKDKRPVSSRFFMVSGDSGRNIYNMIIRSEEDIDHFDIVLGQQGDSSSSGQMSSKIISVENNGETYEIKEVKDKNDEVVYYKICGLKIRQGEPQVYQVEAEEKSVSALKIIKTL